MPWPKAEFSYESPGCTNLTGRSRLCRISGRTVSLIRFRKLPPGMVNSCCSSSHVISKIPYPNASQSYPYKICVPMSPPRDWTGSLCCLRLHYAQNRMMIGGAGRDGPVAILADTRAYILLHTSCSAWPRTSTVDPVPRPTLLYCPKRK